MPSPFQLEIRRPNKPPDFFDVNPGVYTIGRDEDCRIVLSRDEVEPRHAVLTLADGAAWVDDLGSSNGTFVGDVRVQGRTTLAADQELRVGPFTLIVHQAPPASAPASGSERAETAPQPPPPPAAGPGAAPLAGLRPDEYRSIKAQIHKELVERLDIRRLTASGVQEDQLRKTARRTIEAIVAEVSDRLPSAVRADDLVTDIYDEAVGLGPLEALLADPEITEIMVNGHASIYFEKHGRLLASERTFMDDDVVLAVIERIVSPLGRRIDESQPYVDARLADGSRVNAIIHPLSLSGPCLTIRKFSATPFTDQDLVRFGTMTRSMSEFLKIAVRLRKNIVVSGGTGSGKTTLLNVLSSYLPADERIITIEDAAELRLTQQHVVRLEARPPNIEGKGAITIRDLVRNSLRMRPDRIVIGECRGGEALDMLQAMNTGHDGSLTTVHANSPRDAISRLETMSLMSGMELPARAIREQIAAAIDLIVHEARLSDGSRKITCVSEVVGQEGERITLQDIFEYRQTSVDAQGQVAGEFQPTGGVPTFIEEVEAHGLSVDRSMFDPFAGGGERSAVST